MTRRNRLQRFNAPRGPIQLSCALALSLLLTSGADLAAQSLRFTGPPQSSTNGSYLLSLSGPTGQVFEVEASTDLVQWTAIATATNATGLAQAMDTNSAVFRERFYRAGPALVALPDFVKIPAGTFVMGSPLSEAERYDDEAQHTVTLSHDFYMSKYLVTQGQYLALMGNNPSAFTGDLNLPVESVSWYDATNYCWKLTQAERAAGHLPGSWVYRLPTEAEWEYACRAGTTTAFYYGPDLRSGMANFDGTKEYVSGTGTVQNPNGTVLGRTTAVGSYAPNAFGLYDMCGNVSEWCWDWYGPYPTGSVADPSGPSTGSYRVIRGGGWHAGATICRSAVRNFYYQAYSLNFLGFRPVLAPGQP